MNAAIRPEHAFPRLARGLPDPSCCFPLTSEVLPYASRLTPAHRKFTRMIRQGARVLLDITTGECLLYSCANGIRVLARLTVRTLAQLLRHGDLVLASRENHWIHYVRPGGNLAWFQPET